MLRDAGWPAWKYTPVTESTSATTIDARAANGDTRGASHNNDASESPAV